MYLLELYAGKINISVRILWFLWEAIKVSFSNSDGCLAANCNDFLAEEAILSLSPQIPLKSFAKSVIYIQLASYLSLPMFRFISKAEVQKLFLSSYNKILESLML